MNSIFTLFILRLIYFLRFRIAELLSFKTWCMVTVCVCDVCGRGWCCGTHTWRSDGNSQMLFLSSSLCMGCGQSNSGLQAFAANAFTHCTNTQAPSITNHSLLMLSLLSTKELNSNFDFLLLLIEKFIMAISLADGRIVACFSYFLSITSNGLHLKMPVHRI